MRAPLAWPDLAQPLVAILRGVTPDEVPEIGRALLDSGITAIEVPLNSPDPLRSIERLAALMPADGLLGAGTVVHTEDVARVHQAGGRLIVSPNCDPTVIDAAITRGMVTAPGCFTATECYTAYHAGAAALKLFPASLLGTEGIKALIAVLPKDRPLMAVGGVEATSIAELRAAGCALFGLGSNLYKPGRSAAEVGRRARQLIEALD